MGTTVEQRVHEALGCLAILWFVHERLEVDLGALDLFEKKERAVFEAGLQALTARAYAGLFAITKALPVRLTSIEIADDGSVVGDSAGVLSENEKGRRHGRKN